MIIKDNTIDPKVAPKVRNEIMRICKMLNKEEKDKEFRILVNAFEVKSEGD